MKIKIDNMIYKFDIRDINQINIQKISEVESSINVCFYMGEFTIRYFTSNKKIIKQIEKMYKKLRTYHSNNKT